MKASIEALFISIAKLMQSHSHDRNSWPATLKSDSDMMILMRSRKTVRMASAKLADLHLVSRSDCEVLSATANLEESEPDTQRHAL